MHPTIHTIRKRHSIRTFLPRVLAQEDCQVLEQSFEEHQVGPFGAHISLSLLHFSDSDASLNRGIWTYGVIKGAKSFIVGFIEPTHQAAYDYGYCLQHVILRATQLGLGTCWLGGTLNRSPFARVLSLPEGMYIPAVTPVGYPADSRSLMDKALCKLAGSAKRKSFDTLFFHVGGSPLRPEEAGRFAEALECVRLAPSSSNSQPWRVVADVEAGIFHFGVKGATNKPSFKDLDIGIALSHFELACRELSLPGSWQCLSKAPSLPEVAMYVTSWQPSS